MIASLRGLLGKELQHHYKNFAGIGLASALLARLIVWFMDRSQQLLSYLELSALFAFPYLVIIGLALGHLLVSKEYYSRTQQFVESLPIRAGHALFVKYLLGLCILGAIAFSVWSYSLSLANSHEIINQRFIGIMAVRLAAYVIFLWGCVFLVSMLGRWRFALIAALILGLVFIDTQTTWELSRFGPFALVDRELFVGERDVFPLSTSLIAVTLGAMTLLTALALARLNDGSYTESLAVAMSVRDRSFLAMLGVLGIGMLIWFDPSVDDPTEPVQEEQRIVRGKLEVTYLEEPFKSDAVALADYLETPLALLETIVPVASAFKIRVTLAPVADPETYNTTLSSRELGIQVSANFERGSRWNPFNFGIHVIHSVISAISLDRMLLEPNHWLADGFASWWMSHAGKPAPSLDAPATDFLVLALLAAQRVGVNEETLENWDSSNDHLGDSLALALAYSGWRVIEEMIGHAAAIKLAQAELQRPVHGDLRDWWSEWRNPLPRRFEEQTGVSWPDFVIRWRERLEELAAATENARALSTIPAIEVSVSAGLEDSLESVLRFDLTLVKAMNKPLDCVALHHQLPAYNIPIARSSMFEDAFSWPAGKLQMTREIKGEYGSGNRIYAALECQVMPVNLPVRYGVAWVAVP